MSDKNNEVNNSCCGLMCCLRNEFVHKFNVYRSVHRKYIPIYIQQDATLYTVYLYLETALHVSGGTSTHHQERKQLRKILIFWFIYEIIFQYISIRCNFTQFIYIWKLLYMFRAVPPPIIRSANNCIYRNWYLSHRYCYLPLAAGSSKVLTNTRCCRYSCLCSWWWVELPHETCRAVSRYK